MTPEENNEHHEPLVVAERLRVEFGDLVAVRDVSLTLDGGHLLGLIGPNGAGKTTLMRVIAGLQAPTCGTARVMGTDVLDDASSARSHLGFAPDDPPLYDELTIEQFLTFIALIYRVPASIAPERIDFWLEQLWLNDKRREKIGTLSRGMKQRVTVARTLVPNPTVILLDEPSAGLDPAGRIQLRKVLADLRDQGKALIVSSHILADLEEYCTHIAIIEAGRILRHGTVGELHDRALGRHRYRIELAEDNPRLPAVLAEIDGVSNVIAMDGGWTLEYDESPAQAADLLRRLIADDFRVASFAPLADDLEQMYLRSGVKQVN